MIGQEEALKELVLNKKKFAETLLVVENKSRQLVPFIYNPIQANVDASQTGRDIWVKPSQVGFSTERIANRLIDTLTAPGTNTVLVAYEDFITERLLSKVSFFYNHLAGLNIPGFPEIHHDCLPYHTKIQLEDGSFRQIGQIVNKKEQVNVLTCNLNTGEVEPKPIKGWFKYPSRHTWIVLGSGHKFSHMMTPNHHILVGDKWVMAGNVQIGDTTYHNGFTPNDNQKQLIIGSLLGDAHVDYHGGVQFGQSAWEYAKFKHSILVDFSSPLGARLNHGYADNPFYVFRLAASPLFDNYSYRELDARGLAIWYCDDGNRSDHNGSVNFHTESFSVEFHGELIEMLCNNFGIESRIVPHGDYIMLNIPNPRGSGNHDRFFELIAKYVPECMEYKLPEKFRHRSKYEWGNVFGFGLIPYRVAIKDVALTSDRIYNYEYSLEVADNHNFFTSVGLCKNSTYEKTFRFYVDRKLISTSSIYIASARSYVAGRAQTIHHLLCDEFAFYPVGAMERIIAPALARVPPDGTIDIYSTPNGEENDFHDMYALAVEGKSVFASHFYPWFMHPEYVIPITDSRVGLFISEAAKPEFNLTSDEELLAVNHGLTFDQIRWRRWKIKEMESLRRSGEIRTLFPQEFPEDDVSCFISTGDMYFDNFLVDKMANECYPAPYRKEGLNIWYQPEKDKKYLVTIDPGQAKVSQSAIGVLTFDQDKDGNYKPRWCARDAGLYSPEVTAKKAVAASDYYNRAEIAWEANSHGLAITELLKHRRPIYFRKDIISGMPSMEPGWLTTGKNKDYMLGTVHKYLPDFACHDIEVARQMRNHRLVGDKIAVVGASDILMSLAIGLCCMNPKPIKRGFLGKAGWKW